MKSIPKPYYQDDYATIYHGDCRDILPHLEPVDLVLTDPPYPNYLEKEYRYYPEILEPFRLLDCQQIIFWTPSATFPLDFQAVHVWDKATGSNTQFEHIYFRGRSPGYLIHRTMSPHSSVRCQILKDDNTIHPSQKPVQLMLKLMNLCKFQKVLDPFMGSGTTLKAAKMLQRKSIGIEIEEKYCEIAVKRLRQEVLPFGAIK